MHPRLKLILLALCSPLALLVAGCNEEPPPAKPPEPPKVTVSKPIVKDNELDTEEFNGWLVAKDPVEIRSRVRGFVQTIHFKNPPTDKPGEGEFVKKGSPLYDLDSEPFKDEIVQAEQRVNIFRAQKTAADKDLVRLTELEKKGGASRAQIEKAEADVKSFEAQIKAAETEVKLKKRDLEEYSQIKAPIDGRIGRALVSKGELVKSGDTLLATINSIDPIKVQFNADEQTVQRYRKNALAKTKSGKLPPIKDVKIEFMFKLDTDADFSRKGFIDFTDNQTDSKTGTVLIRGETENKEQLLIPGDHVLVRLPISEPYRALMVPDTAINTDQDKKYLLVVDAKNTVQRRDVRLGKLTDAGLRVVETNLTPEDRVVVEGMQRARIGSTITPEEKNLAAEMKKVAGNASP